jgi:antitoxin MazE
MVVQGTVQKWGNSYGIRIRKLIAEKLNIHAGSRIDIDVVDGKMVVTPADPEYSLDELVSGINTGNLHGEVETGRPLGAEIW